MRWILLCALLALPALAQQNAGAPQGGPPVQAPPPAATPPAQPAPAPAAEPEPAPEAPADAEQDARIHALADRVADLEAQFQDQAQLRSRIADLEQQLATLRARLSQTEADLARVRTSAQQSQRQLQANADEAAAAQSARASRIEVLDQVAQDVIQAENLVQQGSDDASGAIESSRQSLLDAAGSAERFGASAEAVLERRAADSLETARGVLTQHDAQQARALIGDALQLIAQARGPTATGRPSAGTAY